jgi:ABC-type multidrug transport system ATPase subunit
METVKKLAQGGRAVICSIHQPREKIFELFDKTLLLTKGRTSFYGPRNQIGSFMASCGQVCPEGEVMADFLLDTMTVDTRTQEKTVETQAICDRVQACYEGSNFRMDAQAEAAGMLSPCTMDSAIAHKYASAWMQIHRGPAKLYLKCF